MGYEISDNVGFMGIGTGIILINYYIFDGTEDFLYNYIRFIEI